MSSPADAVLAAIDGALEDCNISDDAMRWVPDGPPRATCSTEPSTQFIGEPFAAEPTHPQVVMPPLEFLQFEFPDTETERLYRDTVDFLLTGNAYVSIHSSSPYGWCPEPAPALFGGMEPVTARVALTAAAQPPEAVTMLDGECVLLGSSLERFKERLTRGRFPTINELRSQYGLPPSGIMEP